MFTHNITPEVIKTVQNMHRQGISIRQAARSARINYSSAWIIINGKKPKAKVRDEYFNFNNRCPITGFSIYKDAF